MLQWEKQRLHEVFGPVGPRTRLQAISPRRISRAQPVI
jgi:hypothetical protein